MKTTKTPLKKAMYGASMKPSMKAGGPKKMTGAKYAAGGTLKPVNFSANPGLSKLPTEVRNKMGYQKKGGPVKKKK